MTKRSNPNRKGVRRGPHPTLPTPNLISTKEHRRFCEFADTVRVSRYIGLCTKAFHSVPHRDRNSAVNAVTREYKE